MASIVPRWEWRSFGSGFRLAEGVGLPAGRAGVILAGACIVRTVMDKLAIGSQTVSDRGLRHGVMAERFG